MRQRYYADLANSWNVMVENARPVLEAIGPAASRHELLGLKMSELMSLNEQAENHRSELARVVRLRKALSSEGTKVYRRFAADLQAHYGFESTELIRYGLQPKGRPRKSKKKKEEEEAAKAKAEAGKVQVEVAPA